MGRLNFGFVLFLFLFIILFSYLKCNWNNNLYLVQNAINYSNSSFTETQKFIYLLQKKNFHCLGKASSSQALLRCSEIQFESTPNTAEKTLFISRIGSPTMPFFTRQAICSSGLTKMAPLSVILQILHHDNELGDLVTSITSI